MQLNTGKAVWNAATNSCIHDAISPVDHRRLKELDVGKMVPSIRFILSIGEPRRF